ncbi:MAG: TRAP transporter small permease [Burkholderiaceae bacterium]|nr:TRAP transporter small permease [Burkholderiaceae bacterium]
MAGRAGTEAESAPAAGAHGDESPPDDPRNVPRVPIQIEEAAAAIAMALICLITFANVVVRYLTNASFAFTEEISVFLLVVLTLVGAAAAFARDLNIRVLFFAEMLPARPRRALELTSMALSAVLFTLVAWYGWRFFLDDWKFGTTSPGLGIPQWMYSIWLVVLSIAIVARLLGRLWRVWRRG